jgi:hypothetical protein
LAGEQIWIWNLYVQPSRCERRVIKISLEILSSSGVSLVPLSLQSQPTPKECRTRTSIIPTNTTTTNTNTGELLTKTC